MGTFKYLNDFMLTDLKTNRTKRMSEFGGIRYNSDSSGIEYNIPKFTHNTYENDIINGKRLLSTKVEPREIEVPIFLSHEIYETNLVELTKWMCKPYEQIFSWVNDEERKEIKVIYEDVDMKVLYNRDFYATATFSFVAYYPFWNIRNESPLIYRNLNTNSVISNIKSRSNIETYPIITVSSSTSQSNIKIKVNDLVVIIGSLDSNIPIIIDSEKEKCYKIVNDIKVDMFNIFESNDALDYPKFSCEEVNKITILNGQNIDLNINMNSRIL